MLWMNTDSTMHTGGKIFVMIALLLMMLWMNTDSTMNIWGKISLILDCDICYDMLWQFCYLSCFEWAQSTVEVKTMLLLLYIIYTYHCLYRALLSTLKQYNFMNYITIVYLYMQFLVGLKFE